MSCRREMKGNQPPKVSHNGEGRIFAEKARNGFQPPFPALTPTSKVAPLLGCLVMTRESNLRISQQETNIVSLDECEICPFLGIILQPVLPVFGNWCPG